MRRVEEQELSIVTIGDVFKYDDKEKKYKYNLAIPDYQRPYRWKTETALALLNDIIDAQKNNISQYRIGTLILHKNKKGKYEIVDGQQRMTTLTLLLYALTGDENLQLLKAEYKADSKTALKNNYALFKRKIESMKDSDIEDYIRNKCAVVKIVTDSEQEAFQFFDSQNSRGKALAPHDLLKSYHLREMNDESENVKKKIINHWENLDQDYIVELFAEYLYPIINWSKGRNGLGYNMSKIDTFKGIKLGNKYPYAVYHKASHIFIEEFNSKSNKLIGNNTFNEFSLTMPIIAGRRFFKYVFNYYDLTKEVDKIFTSKYGENLLPNQGRGNHYTKQLFMCSLVALADRFGIDTLNEDNWLVDLMYTWAYSLRLYMHSVYKQSINKYAIGEKSELNDGLSMFERISEAKIPEDLERIVVKRAEYSNKRYKEIDDWYKEIDEHIKEINGEKSQNGR